MRLRTALMGACATAAMALPAFAERGADGHVNIIYWQAPSILNRITALLFPGRGSMWISEAFRLYPSTIILLTSWTMAPSSSLTLSRSSLSSSSEDSRSVNESSEILVLEILFAD